jgi:hypothetical protein
MYETKVIRITNPTFPLRIIVGQKQPGRVEYFSCLGSMITNDARRTHVELNLELL